MRDGVLRGQRKFLVIDLLAYSSSHLAVNSFWLKELRRFLDVELVAEQDHAAELEQLVGGALPGRRFRRGYAWALIREVHFVALLLKSRNLPLMILGATGVQIVFLALLERIRPSWASSWLIVLHSEVEGVNCPKGVMKRLAWFSLRVLRFPRYCRGIVLGAHIKRNLDRVRLKNPRIHVIEHPLPDVTFPPLLFLGQMPIRVAVVGLLRSDTKDLHLASQLAMNSFIRVVFIGRKGFGYTTQPGVDEEITSEHYTNGWMAERLKGIDVLLLCPAREKYGFTALGSVTDAMTYGKPLAWVKHEALESYEEGPVSIVAANPRELVEELKRFSAPSPQDVDAWVRGRGDEARGRLRALIARILDDPNVASQQRSGPKAL